MTATIVMHDARLIARIINLAHRFDCGYSRIDVRAREGDAAYDALIDFHGPHDALRRLSVQITKLLDYDKEIFR